MAEYNLLKGDFKNATFAVQFDGGVKKPHFFIVPLRGDHPDFNEMNSEQRQQLIITAKSALASFGINRGILSIHRGRWKNGKTFHAHLCVDDERFLETYRSRKEDIPKPISQGIPPDYEEKVRRHPPKSYKYLKDSLQRIEPFLSDPPPRRNVLPQQLGPKLRAAGITHIIHHQKHPKIGLVGPKPVSNENLSNMFRALEDFAQGNGLVNGENGCHICLYMDSGMYLYRCTESM